MPKNICLIKEAKKAISKKFGIPYEEMVVVPYKDNIAVLHGAPGGKYMGSWDDIMNAPTKDYEVTIGGKTYDTRTAMDWRLYKTFAKQADIKPDKETWTLLTGEPVTDFMKHFWGDSQVPFGYWRDGRVGSNLFRSDDGSDDARPRLAVILCNLSLDSSSLPFRPSVRDISKMIASLKRQGYKVTKEF